MACVCGGHSWLPSALVAAAVAGGVCVLDGVHRLPEGLLYGALRRLLCDRAATLADGTTLLPAQRWDSLSPDGEFTRLNRDGPDAYPRNKAFAGREYPV